MNLICRIFKHKLGPWYQSKNVVEGDQEVHYYRQCSRCDYRETRSVPIGEVGCYWIEGCAWPDDSQNCNKKEK